MPVSQLLKEGNVGPNQQSFATEPSQHLFDKHSWSYDKLFTDTGTLSRTNSPSGSGPDWDGLDDAVVAAEGAGSRFHLVKQLFGCRRESLISEQETGQGDHSKCSSQGENSKCFAGDVEVNKQGCCNSIPDETEHRSHAPLEDGANSPGYPYASHLESNNDEPGNRKAYSDFTDSFRSWPLELRGRAAEWRLSPTVSPHSIAALAAHT